MPVLNPPPTGVHASYLEAIGEYQAEGGYPAFDGLDVREPETFAAYVVRRYGIDPADQTGETAPAAAVTAPPRPAADSHTARTARRSNPAGRPWSRGTQRRLCAYRDVKSAICSETSWLGNRRDRRVDICIIRPPLE